MEHIKISNIHKILVSYFKKLDNFSKDQYSILKKLIKNYDSTCIYMVYFYKRWYGLSK